MPSDLSESSAYRYRAGPSSTASGITANMPSGPGVRRQLRREPWHSAPASARPRRRGKRSAGVVIDVMAVARRPVHVGDRLLGRPVQHGPAIVPEVIAAAYGGGGGMGNIDPVGLSVAIKPPRVPESALTRPPDIRSLHALRSRCGARAEAAARCFELRMGVQRGLVRPRSSKVRIRVHRALKISNARAAPSAPARSGHLYPPRARSLTDTAVIVTTSGIAIALSPRSSRR